MGTIKNLSTALMAFFVLTLFFACEKTEDFTINDLETVEVQETLVEQDKDASKKDVPNLQAFGGSGDCSDLVYINPYFSPLKNGGNSVSFSLMQGFPNGNVLSEATWSISVGEDVVSTTNSLSLTPGTTYSLTVNAPVVDDINASFNFSTTYNTTIQFTLDGDATSPYSIGDFHISKDDEVECGTGGGSPSGGGGTGVNAVFAGWG